MTEQGMSDALDAIHEEALRLLPLTENQHVKEGIELILSIARYKFNLGCEPEK